MRSAASLRAALQQSLQEGDLLSEPVPLGHHLVDQVLIGRRRLVDDHRVALLGELFGQQVPPRESPNFLNYGSDRRRRR